MKQESLFTNKNNEPLASRMRPQTLDEIVGQSHLLGKGKILRQMIDQDQVPSMILWGPPGVGKTTLARVIARHTKAEFISFSAVTSSIKDIKKVMGDAEKNAELGQKTIVFVDEARIQKINRDYRGIDKVTDVISFAFEETQDFICPDYRFLGEIYICIPRMEEQAREYGHSVKRELSFLTVHGLLHLLGYDHMTKEEEEIMFAKQDTILSLAGILR